MGHLKLVASAASPDKTAYCEAFEHLDAGLCIVDGEARY